MSASTNTLLITLRKTEPADLETLFVYQLDVEAAYMAAFVNEKWNDKEAYLAKWNKLLADPTVIAWTILVDQHIVGSIGIWQLMGEPQITYGLGKEYWNRGIATAALRQFLTIAQVRPLFGRTAFDNLRSMKVLTNCGFKKVGEDRAYAVARKEEILEMVFVLEG